MSDFDVIPWEDIKGNWRKLGSGSFGNVYKGTYLGIDVAIKEVLPSNEYDVAKYFEREWRLMKEARHPNVVLYLGLSRAPPPDGRIFIISEFIENGNLRLYIHDKTKPFPWRLRLSFATDIARALAYLHARKCIHRDLKGENLLVTANGRLKITDFGFARIAARNAEEVKRLTFCGTDSYMSPEILLGHEFDLPTDIFSLGVIFCEILARKLADDNTFKRTAPSFTIDAAEVNQLASPGCPPALIRLAIDCMSELPKNRPTVRVILDTLRAIELEVLSRPSEDSGNVHVGSIKLVSGSKRPGAPRIPSFGIGLGREISSKPSESSEDSEDELAEAVSGLDIVNGTILAGHQGHQVLSSNGEDSQPLIDLDPMQPSVVSDYSTTVIKRTPAPPPALSSILTIRSPQVTQQADVTPTPVNSPTNAGNATMRSVLSMSPPPATLRPHAASEITVNTFRTAQSAFAPSVAAATDGSSNSAFTYHGGVAQSALLHRFTLIRPGRKTAIKPAHSAPALAAASTSAASSGLDGGWSPIDFFFGGGLLGGGGAKCDLCTKRLGWKPVLECDDCGLRTHIKCGEFAPRDCGLRAHHAMVPTPAPPAAKLVKRPAAVTSQSSK